MQKTVYFSQETFYAKTEFEINKLRESFEIPQNHEVPLKFTLGSIINFFCYIFIYFKCQLFLIMLHIL